MQIRLSTFGFWAAAGACAASLGYAVAQVLQLLGILADPLDRILIFAPSLALAPFFVVTLVAAYEQAAPAQRAPRLAALGMGILYAGLVSIVYVNQLGVVIPGDLNGDPSGRPFDCCAFRRPMTALDLLGYTYMSIATGLLATTFRRWTRMFLVMNAALAPVILLQLYWPSLIWFASPWLVVFPAAMALIARDFLKSETPG